MTKEEILAMEPGRELDFWIAEHVFKWIPKVNYKTGCVEWRGYSVTGSLSACPSMSNWKNGQPPNYSTDIATAWEVVKYMRGKEGCRGCKACIEIHGTDFDGESLGQGMPYWATVHGEDAGGRTAPEAICKAALLAMEG